MRSKIDQKDARILFQNADMLKEHDAKIAEEANASLKKDNELMTESAYIGIGSSIHNKRVKTQAAERALNYAEHFATVALTEALSECVEKALLLNTDEYAKLNPNYKDEIKATVRNFLESADINENVNTKVMTSLFEAIKSETPPADLYLTEEEEQEIVSSHIMNNATIERNLEALKRDVCSRVANIVTKDQEALKSQEDDLSFADEKELTAAPMVPVQPEPLPGEEEFADPDAIPEGEKGQPEELPAAPVQQESLKIVKENTKRGIVETLAINEANRMLSEGLEYNKTLALANAIKYITILETLDASGIVSIGQQGYNRILSASGVNLNPVPRVNMPGAAITDQPLATVPEAKPVEQPKEVELPNESPKESDIRSKISDIVRSSMPSELAAVEDEKVFEPFAKWKQENANKFGKPLVDIPEKGLNENLRGKYTDRTGTKVYTEAQLREYFENQGFDLNYVDFDGLCESWHFKLHK